MSQIRQGRRGQSTAEYAILIAIVVAAVVGMQTYVKRSLQGKYKAAMDGSAGGLLDAGYNQDDDKGTSGVNEATTPVLDQYEPYYAKQVLTVTQHREVDEEMSGGGPVTRTIVGADGEKTVRTGQTQQLGGANATSDDDWEENFKHK